MPTLENNRIEVKDLRDRMILNLSLDETVKKNFSDNLFNLGLNMYSENYSFNSAIFNAFAMSELDDSIYLHKEQLRILNQISEHEVLIISAPTSFGKTFTIFEYIIRNMPQNIVLIVPTLALVDEYNKKIIKKYQEKFKSYKVHINYDESRKYDFNQKNIFILTHDKIVECNFYDNIESIDFLVIDEVYKLKSDTKNDRVLILNLAYQLLAKKSKRYVLLAPFIKDVLDRNKLSNAPVLYRSDFSPVYNKLVEIDTQTKKEKNEITISLLKNDLSNQKNLVYFPRVNQLSKFVKNYVVENFPQINTSDDDIINFLNWAKEEIHEDWYVVKAMERGVLIHNGQLPIGVRNLQINTYEKNKDGFYNMMCTSTLLEGVNICAKNIIITSPKRDDKEFDAFDFYNLVGRTGRLNQHYVGCAYYLKGKDDKIYYKDEAIKEIRFELTDEESKDFDICNGNYDKHEEFVKFLKELNIAFDDYASNIGFRYRFFTTINDLYLSYKKYKEDLFKVLSRKNDDPKSVGRQNIVYPLLIIINGAENKREININSRVIALSLHYNRYSVRKIIEKVLEKIPDLDIDDLIGKIVRNKYGFIEHDLYTKTKIICYFMRCNNVKDEIIKTLEREVVEPIERLYFSDSNIKKTLIGLGIYEKDIEIIIQVIGDKFNNTFDLKEALKNNLSKFKGLSFISEYIIKNY